VACERPTLWGGLIPTSVVHFGGSGSPPGKRSGCAL